ncbi:hypothetical protein [Algoriphagus sp. Y33]|uniref:hypothetical protein n=1 Tax=Algoriphagus sp. Y33 TaxID=2772483 RepID=UPI00177BA02C|nr:hypothetical protein [Algoriphagus sp. Y33]
MKHFLTLPLLLFLFLQGCQEENTLNPVEFYWEQTHCTDPWYNSAHESDGGQMEKSYKQLRVI